jgi:hypothetical protein
MPRNDILDIDSHPFDEWILITHLAPWIIIIVMKIVINIYIYIINTSCPRALRRSYKKTAVIWAKVIILTKK